MDLNSPPSHFDHHHPFVPNRSSSSSSSLSCHFFFDSTRDHAGLIYDHHQLRLYEPNHHVPDDQSYGYNHSGSTYEMKNKVDSGLNFTLWKKEEEEDDDDIRRNPMTTWMSSKMRVMQKMKTADHDHRVASSSNDGDQKLQPSSSSPETDLSSNSSSYNNSPIRVCSDCNTTKTPLWRSGPKGPKSLCNACGIRQRKARRAMAAAAATAAAANDASANTTSDHPTSTATKIKLQQKGKNGKNGHASQLKKRCKTAVAATGTSGAASNEKKRLGFEDFLINLSKNLAIHRVFPDDERDAAILLMALSSGLVNG